MTRPRWKVLRWVIALVMFAAALLALSRVNHDWDLPTDPNHHRAITETVAGMILAAPLLAMMRGFRGRGARDADRKS